MDGRVIGWGSGGGAHLSYRARRLDAPKRHTARRRVLLLAMADTLVYTLDAVLA